MRQSIPRHLRTLGWSSGILPGRPSLFRSFGLFGDKKKTHYQTLEIQSNATVKDVKKAFMKKAKIYHPDVAKDKFDPDIFKEILEAYETLSDPNKKQTYDLGLSNPAFTDEDVQRHSQNIRENDYSKTFYLNKWYNFKKPEEDLRFEYTEKTSETWIAKALGNMYFKIGFVLAVILLYDFSQYLKKKRAEEYGSVKEKVFGFDQELSEEMKRIEEYVLARELAVAESAAKGGNASSQ